MEAIAAVDMAALAILALAVLRGLWIGLIREVFSLAGLAAVHDFNARVAVPGGFRLRNPAAERQWATPGGKAAFSVRPLAQDTPTQRAHWLALSSQPALMLQKW